MTRRLVTGLVGVAAVPVLWLWSQGTAQQKPLAQVFPAGSMLYLEARDFRSLLSDWNASAEKKLWLASDNYQVFSRTNLFLKLGDAHTEFTQAAGFAADLPFVQSVAGQNAGLAVYDIGALEFLYITRIDSSAALQSALLQRRSSYESRSSAGKPYHVRRWNRRTAAFAFTDGLLLLATREDLIANALKLLAGQPEPSITSEEWYRAGTQARTNSGEIRMLLNMPRLLESSQFRSYWIQRNVSELKPYRAGVIDLFREAGQFREERVLIREEAAPAAGANASGVAQVLAWAPDDVGLRRAWATPTCADAIDLLRTKLVAPGPGNDSPNGSAPASASPDATVGTAADLEVRIDERPLEDAAKRDVPEPFQRACEQAGISALLHVQRSRTAPDGVYIDNESAVALLGSREWPEVRMAGLHVHRQGRALVVASSSEMLAAVVARLGNAPAASAGHYVARYSHARELQPFGRMMGLIDASKPRPEYADASARQFFSGNVASLGSVLGRLQTVDVTVNASATDLRQVVIYTIR